VWSSPVEFRTSGTATAAGLALARDVRGWVRNCSAGSVEAVFEGSLEAVGQMISWCRKGPPRARVDNVEVTAEPVQNEIGFLIR
jgi:acylphosphatase